MTGPPPAEVSSGVRVRGVLATWPCSRASNWTGPVLLVDDVIRTRWTVTVASSLLVEAGAAAVLLLAVHLHRR